PSAPRRQRSRPIRDAGEALRLGRNSLPCGVEAKWGGEIHDAGTSRDRLAARSAGAEGRRSVVAAEPTAGERPETLDGDQSRRMRVRAVIASATGTTIEWYDFFLYGVAAALVFPQKFFPESDPFVGTLAAFSTYFVGFVARPFGAALFGHFGDRIGRKAALISTLVLMG